MHTRKNEILVLLWKAFLLLQSSFFVSSYALGQKSENLKFFFDANSTSFQRDGSRQLFEGNVVAIGHDVILTADLIDYNREDSRLTAKGHVIIISKNRIFFADELIQYIDSGDFSLENAVVINNSPEKIEKIKMKVLGFSDSDISYELSRKKELARISRKKKEIKEKFYNTHRALKNDRMKLTEQYTTLLQQEALIKKKKTADSRSLSKKKADIFNSRKKFWQDSKNKMSNFSSRESKVYFRIAGEKIEKVDGYDYRAREATWTPCYCEENEIPAWGIRADKIEANVGGYADFYHPVLEIKGIPVFYLPFLKVPIKEKRQSGFLLPTITYKEESGNIFSLPVYFALSDNSDATITSDFIDKRGTRIGMEYRKQYKEYSGWSLQLEGIRDRLWINDLSTRLTLSRVYEKGFNQAKESYRDGEVLAEGEQATVSSPEWWRESGLISDDILDECLAGELSYSECFEKRQGGIKSPSNRWRGQMSWKGGLILAPRFSIVSEGEILSDHRYTDDLYIPRNFIDVVAPSGVRFRSFAKTKGQIHVDASQFYLGLGLRYGDQMNSDSRWSGYQIPLRLKLQSRLFDLGSMVGPFPIYAQLSYELQQISANKLDLVSYSRLGAGSWQKAKLDLVVPLVHDSFVSVDHFADAEIRKISYEGLGDDGSTISSWRTGLRFNVPLHGEMKLPFQLLDDDPTGASPLGLTPMMQHRMNWGVALSLRPSVTHSGDYASAYDRYNTDGAVINTSRLMSYYSSDRTVDLSSASGAEIAPDEISMMRHKKLIFTTEHSWQLFNQGYEFINKSNSDADIKEEETYKERARRELLHSLDQEIATMEEREGDSWFLSRYRPKTFGRVTPLTFSARIDYDLVKEEERNRAKPAIEEREAFNKGLESEAEAIKNSGEEGRTDEAKAILARRVKVGALPESWSLLSSKVVASWKKWSLSIDAKYNIYSSLVVDEVFSLSLPSFWKTTLGFGYRVQKSPVLEQYGGFTEVRVQQKSVKLVTNIIPRVNVLVGFAENYYDEKPSNYSVSDVYQSKFGVVYSDPSRCWGLRFSRVKDFKYAEENASYLIELNIDLFGKPRSLPNMAPSIMSQVPVGENR